VAAGVAFPWEIAMSVAKQKKVPNCGNRMAGVVCAWAFEELLKRAGRAIVPFVGKTPRKSLPVLRELRSSVPKSGAQAENLLCGPIWERACHRARRKPSYEPDRRVLRLGRAVLRRFARRCRQADLLAAFESAGWPPSIVDPLGAPAATDADHGYRDLVCQLNKGQGSSRRVQFWCERRAVHWRVVDARGAASREGRNSRATSPARG
jgi:hypothetical protein